MKQFHAFQRQKNDVLFAFVMAAVFAITVVGAVAGAVDLARGHAPEVARGHGQAVAMRDPAREHVIAPSGARQ